MTDISAVPSVGGHTSAYAHRSFSAPEKAILPPVDERATARGSHDKSHESSAETRAQSEDLFKLKERIGPDTLAGPTPSFKASILEIDSDLQNLLARLDHERSRTQNQAAITAQKPEDAAPQPAFVAGEVVVSVAAAALSAPTELAPTQTSEGGFDGSFARNGFGGGTYPVLATPTQRADPETERTALAQAPAEAPETPVKPAPKAQSEAPVDTISRGQSWSLETPYAVAADSALRAMDSAKPSAAA